MRNALTIFFGLLLAVCLTLYGPVSMAKAGGGAVFSMEICADGVAKTVLFDADGNPVEPAQSCPECLTCCQAISALAPPNCSALPSFVLLNMEADSPSAQDPVLPIRNIFPAPRGPPAVQISMQNATELALFYHPATETNTRSDGRPLVKDADA